MRRGSRAALRSRGGHVLGRRARPAARTTRTDAREPYTPRGWIVILGGAATSAVVLAAWLPVGALFNQREQMSATSTRLSQLEAQGQLLTAESKRLATPEEAARLAREEYQLVEPGQRLIQVLTPGEAPSSKSTGGPYPGDPGLAPIVAPGAAAVLPGGAGGAASPAHAATAARAAAGGFLSRVVAALEFWR